MVRMRINFTQSEIEEMLDVITTAETPQEEVFAWLVDGKEVTITVGEDEE